MIHGGMWMPLTLALHHEQNMPAIKVKYTLPALCTWKYTKSYFIYMCNVWHVSGCKRKARWLFGRSRTVKCGSFRWGGGFLQSVQMEHFLNSEDRSDMGAWDHLVSVEKIMRWVVRLCDWCVQASKSDFSQDWASSLCPEEIPLQDFSCYGQKNKQSGDTTDED